MIGSDPIRALRAGIKKIPRHTIHIFLGVLFLCSFHISGYADSKEVIKSAAEYDYPPFSIVSKDGKADGFSVELLRAALSEVDLDVEYTTGPWAQLTKDLSEGTIQVLPLVGRTPEREAIYDFTFPYLSVHGAIFVRKGDGRIKSLDDLEDMTIVVMRGDNAEEFVRRKKVSSRIIAVETYTEAMQLLDAGTYDAVIAQRLMGIHLLKKIGLQTVAPLDFVIRDFKQDFCFAVREGNRELLSLLNEGLSIVIANGTFDQLHEKWFGPLIDRPISSKDIFKYILIIFIPFAVIAVLFSIFLLRREVTNKTKNLRQEIEERMQVEKTLRKSEQKFKNIVNSSPMGMHLYELKDDNRLVFIGTNPASDQILGVSHKPYIGKTIEEAFPGLVQTDVPERYRDVARYGKAWKTENVYYQDDVITGAFEVVAFQTETNKMVALFNNITYRKQAELEKEKLQAQLLQAQKMEAIGHLAGGVAHDFNNILSAIVGYAHIMLLKMKDDDPLRRNLDQILASSEKAANLTKSLLAFSRKQIIQMKPVNINNIVLGMTRILERIIGEDIYLLVNTVDHDLIVNLDTNQIEQGIMNLATNARDTMPGGGTLTVSTEECEIDEKYIQMHQEGEVGTYAVLSVTDTGEGMDEKTKENIFEPFFTTKEIGRGTGLGLAMVYGTIKQHNGFINVYSEPGIGTTFRIYLPLAESREDVTEKVDSPTIPSGTETILFVEDDEAVRSATKGLLKEFGYTVIEASNGKQAIELYKKHTDIIQLVITDIIMPGQNGKDLQNELIKITSDIKVLFISGYPSDVLNTKGIIDSEITLVQKPSTPEILLNAVRKVLDE